MFPKVSECNSIHFTESNCNESGLKYIEYGNSLPFPMKRIYYLYNIDPSSKRGNHAHRKLIQCIIPLSGKIEVFLTDGQERKVIDLVDPKIGLIIHPYIWKELYFTSRETVGLIIASDIYSENDYVRSYDDFLLIRDSNK